MCNIIVLIKGKNGIKGGSRWQLGGKSRQCELCKSKILLRHYSHTWQNKVNKENQNSDTLNPQKYKAPPYHITLRKQTPTPNLLRRHRPTGE
jgi:hypothetical protein